MEFQLLGPVKAFVDGRSCAIGPAKNRQVLAILLLANGQPVTTLELTDKVWDEDPPATARELLHGIISSIRRHLNDGEPGAGGMLTTSDGGYRMTVPSRQVDLYRFQEWRDRAVAHVGHDRTTAAQAFREALDEWAGDAGRFRDRTPLADLRGRWVENARVALQQQYREALVAYLETELHLGRHSQHLSTLTGLADDRPTDEQLAGLLMVARYRAGSPAIALEVFDRIRQRLAEDLGADPSRELKELHQQVMNQDPALDLPTHAPAASNGGTNTTMTRSSARDLGDGHEATSPPDPEDNQVPPSGARPTRGRPRPDDSTRNSPKPDPAAADPKHVVVLGGRHAFTGATVTADQVTGGDSYEIHVPEERG